MRKYVCRVGGSPPPWVPRSEIGDNETSTQYSYKKYITCEEIIKDQSEGFNCSKSKILNALSIKTLVYSNVMKQRVTIGEKSKKTVGVPIQIEAKNIPTLLESFVCSY